MALTDLDTQVRMAAFDWLAEQVRTHGDVLPSTSLRAGFAFGNQAVKLMGPQGIFKPKILPKIPISITTVAPKPGRERPYDDSFSDDGLLRYRYRGTNPAHHDNVGLRRAMERRIPLIYFHGIVPGHYFAAWPVFVVGDDPRGLSFQVAIDDAAYISPDLDHVSDEGANARRAYITSATKRRLHQRGFRYRVLRAYREMCALCQLRHEELLDAAHIVPDSHPDGEPTVSNGLALCKLHHAAFDHNLLGVTPDYVVKVCPAILSEEDGPMLMHGLIGMHDRRIALPNARQQRPSPMLLQVRYSEFLEANR